MASRLPSQWLALSDVSDAAGAYHEGSVLDRVIYIALMAMAALVLRRRPIEWKRSLLSNVALTLLVLFSFVSIAWSDFPFVALKRWVKDLGTFLMVILVLSDSRPLDAVHTLLRRVFYLLIPLSVILVKYYPGVGRGYSNWTGEAFYIGVATSKNMLGILCLVSAMFFIWDTARRWPQKRQRLTRYILLINVIFLGMTLWLIKLANSAMATFCLLIGGLVILSAYTFLRKRPSWIKVLIPTGISIALLAVTTLNLMDTMIHSLGRDTTLTGRTRLWADLLSFGTNPILGSGYESFWLGERLDILWMNHTFRPNQAHNGYLEIYLNLGILGLSLVIALLVSAYRTLCRRLSTTWDAAVFGLSIWVVLILSNVTEAAFKVKIIWLTFLIVTVVLPTRRVGHATPRLLRSTVNGTAREPSPQRSTLSSMRRDNPMQGQH
jgi:O-antigen ligase